MKTSFDFEKSTHQYRIANLAADEFMVIRMAMLNEASLALLDSYLYPSPYNRSHRNRIFAVLAGLASEIWSRNELFHDAIDVARRNLRIERARGNNMVRGTWRARTV